MKCRSVSHIYINFRSNSGWYWRIIYTYDVYASNILQDIRKMHWTIKYRSLGHTFILRSNFWSYWHIIRKYGVYTWNSPQNLKQNRRTVKTLQDIGAWNIGHTDLHFNPNTGQDPGAAEAQKIFSFWRWDFLYIWIGVFSWWLLIRTHNICFSWSLM